MSHCKIAKFGILNSAFIHLNKNNIHRNKNSKKTVHKKNYKMLVCKSFQTAQMYISKKYHVCPSPHSSHLFASQKEKKEIKGKKERVPKQNLLKASYQCLGCQHDYRLRMIIGCKFQLTITTKSNCFNTTLKLFEI